MSWEQLTVAVKAAKTTGKWSIGTGFPVARGLILTALHVVEPDGCPTGVRVRRWHCRVAGFGPEDGANGDGFLDAETVWCDRSLDVALLSAPHPDETGFVELSDAEPEDGRRITGEGFPDAARINGRAETIRLPGRIHSPHASGGYCEVTMDPNPTLLADWGGASGALVFPEGNSSGKAIAILINARQAMGNNCTLHAVPTAAILRSPGFAERIETEWETHRPDHTQIEKHRKSLVRVLASKLRLLKSDDLRMALERCGLGHLSSDRPEHDRIAEALAERPGEAVQELRALQKETEEAGDASAPQLGYLIWTLAALDLDERAIRFVSYMRGDSAIRSLPRQAGPACTLTYLELLAAAIDGGMPVYLPRYAEDDLPRGLSCMPFVTPECGPDGDPLAVFLEDLVRRSGITPYPIEQLQQRIESELAHPDRRLLRNAALREGERLDDAAAGRLRQALERRRLDGERTFYASVVVPKDPDEAKRLRVHLEALRARYSAIVVFALDADNDRREDEETALARVIRSVPIKDSIP